MYANGNNAEGSSSTATSEMHRFDAPITATAVRVPQHYAASSPMQHVLTADSHLCGKKDEEGERIAAVNIEADKLKFVVQYYGQWKPPPESTWGNGLKWIKQDLLPTISFDEVQLSLLVRGKQTC